MALTTETDLSFLYHLLRIFLRPFRPRLAASDKHSFVGSPAGSLLLTIPSKSKCSISHQEVKGINVYEFHPISHSTASTSTKPTHRILYFAGGGFQSPPSTAHWAFCEELCLRLAGLYEITLVSYPLAPGCPAPKSLPILHKWLKATCVEGIEAKESLTLMGDSAGGNIALSLAFWWVSHLEHENEPRHHGEHASTHMLEGEIERATETEKAESTDKNRSPLKNVFVISPPTDMRNQNRATFDADKHDPILSIPLINSVAQAWAGTDTHCKWDLDRPELSPNLQDASKFMKMRQLDIRIHGVVGTWDVLAPDALVFYQKCKQHGIEGEWLKWERQMHCFPLAWKYGLSEGKRGLEWILAVLRTSV
ncbi:hypothetical protein D9758_009107 [Tetrapyrgos nigripes]|uniref:Alpha/beta hydrolase fold-3 domain-containing protein n=1 Tax=Tetrapyrgos nigripes TaxID=182062 RepID=A0A8H5LK45_9AGAR|nr:hypothetical protein D9758_009107 [Tetrapyrgos nigripes]